VSSSEANASVAKTGAQVVGNRIPQTIRELGEIDSDDRELYHLALQHFRPLIAVQPYVQVNTALQLGALRLPHFEGYNDFASRNPDMLRRLIFIQTQDAPIITDDGFIFKVR